MAHTPRYVRQGCAVDKRDRGAQAVQDGMPATPVDRIFVRVHAGLRQVRSPLHAAVDDRRLAEYARRAFNVAPLRPVEFNGAQLVTDRLGFHQQLAELRGLLIAVLRKRTRVSHRAARPPATQSSRQMNSRYR